ncbi:MAG: hypothetical protein WCC92_15505 [Candidatus Korobacteraceae bacterium]
MTDSKEFRWLREKGDSLPARYEFRWIAVDGEQIGKDRIPIEEIIVADGDTLGETIALVRVQGRNPLELFYVFVRPSLSEPLQRQQDAESYMGAGYAR